MIKPTTRPKMLKLSAAILAASCGVAHAALPTEADATYGSGDANYTVDAALENGTITASQDSVIKFYENNSAGNSLNIGVGETLNVQSTGGSIQLLIRDLGDQSTQIFGSLAGDGNVTVFLQNQNGIVFGSDSSVTNVPGLVATTHSFDDAAFQNYADGTDPLEVLATGGRIEVQGLNVVDGNLVLVADFVDITGNVVSNGSFQIGVGNRVELGLPSGDLISVDITEALADTGGILNLASVEASSIDWQAAFTDPAALAVNSQGVVRATGVAVGSDGSINIVADRSVAFIGGSLEAQGAVNLAGNTIAAIGEVTASQINVELQTSTGGAGGVIDLDSMRYDAPDFNINGESGANHRVIGFSSYRVIGDNQSEAEHDLFQGAGAQDVDLSNIALLQGSNRVDNTFIVDSGASITELTGGGRQDVFTIRGDVVDLNGGNGNDLFIMEGGNVMGTLDGGSDNDDLVSVFLRDASGNQTNDFTGQTSSEFVANWTSIEDVTPAIWPVVPVDPVDPTPTDGDTPDNLLATSPDFSNLDGVGSTTLNLTGDNAMNTPCGVMTDRDQQKVRDEDCFDKPDYLAMLKTTIYFDNDSSQILAPAAAKLDRVSEFVLDYGHFNEVSVSGHTDANASNAYNLELSERRANSTVRYMTEKGVGAELFKTYFYGEELPAVPNDTLENLAKNRRAVVELKR